MFTTDDYEVAQMRAECDENHCRELDFNRDDAHGFRADLEG